MSKTMIVDVICSWCNKHMGKKIAKVEGGEPVSHGICRDCYKEMTK